MAQLTTVRRAGVNSRRASRSRLFRTVVVIVLGVFFLLPLYAMAEFTTRPIGTQTSRSLGAWTEIASHSDLLSGVVASLELAVGTSVVMLVMLVPTMIWVRLRLPRVQRILEFLCLLPLTIPAIVLVVGLAPVYLWVTYFFGSSPLTLVFAYVVLTLPYAFGAIDAGLTSIDLKTLSEVARSLGASWPTVFLRVVTPNIAGSVLNASMLSVALVIGEFTVASILNFQTLQTEIFLLGRVNAPVSVAVALASLLFSFALLFAISFVGRRGRSRPTVEVPSGRS